MLDNPDLHTIVTEVLTRQLKSQGFERANVQDGNDQDGEAALFVEALFSLPSGRVHAHELVDAQVALLNVLSSRGETRFPYLSYRFPDEVEPLPDDIDLRPVNANR